MSFIVCVRYLIFSDAVAFDGRKSLLDFMFLSVRINLLTQLLNKVHLVT